MGGTEAPGHRLLSVPLQSMARGRGSCGWQTTALQSSFQRPLHRHTQVSYGVTRRPPHHRLWTSACPRPPETLPAPQSSPTAVDQLLFSPGTQLISAMLKEEPHLKHSSSLCPSEQEEAFTCPRPCLFGSLKTPELLQIFPQMNSWPVAGGSATYFSTPCKTWWIMSTTSM